ncbi:MAG: N-acetylneuraminate synthase family protein, partial [Deltaproteobacteria bacterium]|nr:N-acetylneuraminate synthase family protein [Deltaproteobacteria bacterium]
MKAVKIEDRWVGEGHPCFVIAEAGVNHDGDIGQAMRLVDAAASAGADAVKFQAFKAEKLATPDAPKAAYQARATDASESQYRMLKRLELSEDDHRKLSDYCRRRGILFLSTPYDEESADFLSGIGIPAFKVSSGDLTNHPFLEHLAGKGKPVLLSTGMSSLPEVGEAIGVLRKAGAKEIVLLHAVSCYPADPADVNLKAIRTLSGEFDLPVGYSDHTLGVEVACAAVALGACMIEKHVTLDRNLPGPDHRASLEPGELETLVRGIRIVE